VSSLHREVYKNGYVALAGCLVPGLCLMIKSPTIVHSDGLKCWVRLNSIRWQVAHDMLSSQRTLLIGWLCFGGTEFRTAFFVMSPFRKGQAVYWLSRCVGAAGGPSCVLLAPLCRRCGRPEGGAAGFVVSALRKGRVVRCLFVVVFWVVGRNDLLGFQVGFGSVVHRWFRSAWCP